MASTAFQNLNFDESRGSVPAAFSLTAAGRADELLGALAPKLMVMGGLALFACALAVAFRVIALDAVLQLQQPAIDFAICGAVGFLGLSIAWVNLGEGCSWQLERAAEQKAATASLPSAALPAAPPVALAAASPSFRPPSAPRRQRFARRFAASRFCSFCGHKMMSLGASRYQCSACRHSEGQGPVSFLDNNSACHCSHCS